MANDYNRPNEFDRPNEIEQSSNRNLEPTPNKDNKPLKKAGDGTMTFMVWSMAGTVIAACSSPIFSDVADLTGGGGSSGDTQGGPDRVIATDGRARGADVYIDNGDGQFDSNADTSLGTTNDAGYVDLDFLSEGAVVFVDVNGAVDTATGEPLSGIWRSLPYSGSGDLIVSPVTNLLALRLEAVGPDTVEAMAFYQETLNSILGAESGVTVSDILDPDNYNVEGNTATQLVSRLAIGLTEIGAPTNAADSAGTLTEVQGLFADYSRNIADDDATNDAVVLSGTHAVEVNRLAAGVESRPVVVDPNEGNTIDMTEGTDFVLRDANSDTVSLFGFEDPQRNDDADGDGVRDPGQLVGIYIQAESADGNIAVRFGDAASSVALASTSNADRGFVPGDVPEPLDSTFFYVSEANLGRLVLRPVGNNGDFITDPDDSTTNPEIRFYVYDGEDATVDVGGSLDRTGELEITVAQPVPVIAAFTGNIADADPASDTNRPDSVSGTFSTASGSGTVETWMAVPRAGTTAYGTLSVTDDDWTFTLNADGVTEINRLDAGDTPAQAVFDVTATNTAGSDTATLTISLTGIDDDSDASVPVIDDFTGNIADADPASDTNRPADVSGTFSTASGSGTVDTWMAVPRAGTTAYGTISVTDDDWTFTLNADGVTEINRLDAGDTPAQAVFDVTATNAGGTDTSTLTISLTGIDDDSDTLPSQLAVESEGARAFVVIYGVEFRALENLPPHNTLGAGLIYFSNNVNENISETDLQYGIATSTFSQANIADLWNTYTNALGRLVTQGFVATIIEAMPNIDTFAEWVAGSNTSNGLRNFTAGTVAADLVVTENTDLMASGWLQVTGATGDITFGNGGGTGGFTASGQLGSAAHTDTRKYTFVGDYGDLVVDGDGDWVYTLGGSNAQNTAVATLTSTVMETFRVTVNEDGSTRSVIQPITITVNGFAVSSEGARDSVVIYGVEFRALENIPPPRTDDQENENRIYFRNQADNDPVHFSASSAFYRVSTTDFSQADIARIWNTDTTSNSGFVATIIDEMSNIDMFDEWRAMEPDGAETGVGNVEGARRFTGYTAEADRVVTEGDDLTASGWLRVTGGTGDITYGDGTAPDVTVTGTNTPADHIDTREYTYAGRYGNLVIDGDGDWVYTLGGTTDQDNAVEALTSTNGGTDPFEVTVRETGGAMRTRTEMIEITVNGVGEVAPAALEVTSEAVRAFVIVNGVEFRINADSNAPADQANQVVFNTTTSGAGVYFGDRVISVFILGDGNANGDFSQANIVGFFNDPNRYNDNDLTNLDIAAIILEEDTSTTFARVDWGSGNRHNFSPASTTLDTTVTEDDAADSTARGFLQVTDATDADTYTYTGGTTTVIGTGTNAVTYEIFEGDYGQLIVDGDGNWTYVLDNTDDDTQGLRDQQAGTDRFTIIVSDGAIMGRQQIEITVNGAADVTTPAPEIDDTNSVIMGDITDTDAGDHANIPASASGTITATGTGITWSSSDIALNNFPSDLTSIPVADFVDMLTLTPSGDGTSVTWEFIPTDEINALRAADTDVTITYTITASNVGGPDTTTLTINLDGVDNVAPEIVTTGSQFDTQTIPDMLEVSTNDPDAIEGTIANSGAFTATGTVTGWSYTMTGFTGDTNSRTAADFGSFTLMDNGEWTFDPTTGINDLDTGQSVTFEYAITADNAAGSSTPQTFTITLQGRENIDPTQIEIESEGARSHLLIYGVEFRSLVDGDEVVGGAEDGSIFFPDNTNSAENITHTTTGDFGIRTADFSQANIADLWNTYTDSGNIVTEGLVATIIDEMSGIDIDTLPEWRAMEDGGAEVREGNIFGTRDFTVGTDEADLEVTEGTDLTASGWLQVTGAMGDIIFGAGGTSRVTATGELGGTSGNAAHTDTRKYTYAGKYGNLVIDGDGDWVYTLGGTTDQNNALAALTSTNGGTDPFEVTVRETGGAMRSKTEMIEIAVTGADVPAFATSRSGTMVTITDTDRAADNVPAPVTGTISLTAETDVTDLTWTIAAPTVTGTNQNSDYFFGFALPTSFPTGFILGREYSGVIGRELEWSFTPNEKINDLNAGQSVTFTYSITVMNVDGTTNQDLVVTLNGFTPLFEAAVTSTADSVDIGASDQLTITSATPGDNSEDTIPEINFVLARDGSTGSAPTLTVNNQVAHEISVRVTLASDDTTTDWEDIANLINTGTVDGTGTNSPAEPYVTAVLNDPTTNGGVAIADGDLTTFTTAPAVALTPDTAIIGDNDPFETQLILTAVTPGDGDASATDAIPRIVVQYELHSQSNPNQATSTEKITLRDGGVFDATAGELTIDRSGETGRSDITVPEGTIFILLDGRSGSSGATTAELVNFINTGNIQGTTGSSNPLAAYLTAALPTTGTAQDIAGSSRAGSIGSSGELRGGLGTPGTNAREAFETGAVLTGGAGTPDAISLGPLQFTARNPGSNSLSTTDDVPEIVINLARRANGDRNGDGAIVSVTGDAETMTIGISAPFNFLTVTWGVIKDAIENHAPASGISANDLIIVAERLSRGNIENPINLSEFSTYTLTGGTNAVTTTEPLFEIAELTVVQDPNHGIANILAGNTVVTNELFQGGDGNDTITTNGGNDVVIGGAGTDTITLGAPNAGAETIVYRFTSDGDAWGGADGNDTVDGFEYGVDELVLVDVSDSSPIVDLAAFDDDTARPRISVFTGDGVLTVDALQITFGEGGAVLTINFVGNLPIIDSTATGADASRSIHEHVTQDGAIVRRYELNDGSSLANVLGGDGFVEVGDVSQLPDGLDIL